MQLRALTVAEAAQQLDTSKATVNLMLAQMQTIVSRGVAHSQCAMCLRFPDGEVLSDVVRVRRRTKC